MADPTAEVALLRAQVDRLLAELESHAPRHSAGGADVPAMVPRAQTGTRMVKNSSGGALARGSVVVSTTALTTDDTVTTSTTRSDERVVGVLLQDLPSTAIGIMAFSGGVQNVKVIAGVTRYQFLKQSTTAGSAEGVANFSHGCFGMALSSRDATLGTVRAILFGSTFGLTIRLGVNWLDYGADNTGVADSAAAINAATLVAASVGARISYGPAGTYLLEVSLVPQNDVRLSGAGWQATYLKVKNSTNINAIDTTAAVYRARITDLAIDGNKANQTANGIGLKLWLDHGEIDHVWFQNIRQEAIYLCPGDGYADAGYPAGNGFDNQIRFVEIQDSDIGIRYTSKLVDAWIGPRVNIGSTTANLYCTSQGSPILVFKNWFNGNPTNNIYYPAAGTNIWFTGNTIENAKHENILITEPSFIAGDHASSIHLVDNFIKNAGSAAANTYNAIDIQGFSVTKRTLGVTIVGNSFVTDVNTPKYAVSLNNVKRAAIVGNESQAMGTGYWKLLGAVDQITILGNAPGDWAENQKITADATVGSAGSATGNLFSFTVQGGNLRLDGRIRIRLEGKYTNNDGAVRTLQLSLQYGATTMIDITSGNITQSATARAFVLECELIADGATNAQNARLLGFLSAVSTAASGTGSFSDISTVEQFTAVGYGTAAEDSTADKTLKLVATHSVASANLTLLIDSVVVEVL